MGLASSISIGLVGALIMLIGAWQIEAGALTVGGLFAYVLFLGFLVVPLAQMAGIGSQFGEAIAGLERTRELLLEPTEEADSARSVSLPAIIGDIVFEDVSFAYSSGEPVLSRHFISRPSRNGDGIGRLLGFWKVDDYRSGRRILSLPPMAG